MRSKPWIPALAVIIISLFFAGASASGNAPKFHRASSSIEGAALVVSFDERGLGNENVDYRVTANASAVYGCINGGGNHPQAANKETVNAEVSASASFEVKNGRVIASIKTGPPGPGSFSCPKGQRLVLGSVSYTNVRLTDLTNNVSASPGDASRVLVAF